MINNTFDLLWRDISPFTIGFDRTFDTLSLLANSKQQTSNYPPYNIRKVSEDKYTIELAVAGFSEEDITIEVKEGILAIVGETSEDERAYVHKGISSRKFEKSFRISEFVVVDGANLVDGVLVIDLRVELPEEKRPRKINIGSTGKSTKKEFIQE